MDEEHNNSNNEKNGIRSWYYSDTAWSTSALLVLHVCFGCPSRKGSGRATIHRRLTSSRWQRFRRLDGAAATAAILLLSAHLPHPLRRPLPPWRAISVSISFREGDGVAATTPELLRVSGPSPSITVRARCESSVPSSVSATFRFTYLRTGYRPFAGSRSHPLRAPV